MEHSIKYVTGYRSDKIAQVGYQKADNVYNTKEQGFILLSAAIVKIKLSAVVSVEMNEKRISSGQACRDKIFIREYIGPCSVST